MRATIIISTALLALTAHTPEGMAQSTKGLKLCVNKVSGALASRSQCGKAETALSLKSLAQKVTDEQGGVGSEFSVVLGEGSSTNSTIPGATQIPGFPPTSIPGSLSKSASCVNGIVFASSCESSDLTNLSVSGGTTANGKTVQCSWSNSAQQDKVGLFYVKLVCADL